MSMITTACHPRCSSKKRTATPPEVPSAPQYAEVLEEIRQLRAAVSVYRQLVDRLMRERRAA
jgi:hypothetical protein